MALQTLQFSACDDGAPSGTLDARGSDTSPDLSNSDSSEQDASDTANADTAPDAQSDTATAPTDAVDTVEETVAPIGCAVADELFTPYCTLCHDKDANFPDLTPGALKYLVGTRAFAYPDEFLVVAGDPEASLLYRKVHGPAAGEGSIMPPVDEVPAEAIAALEAWIQDGAKPCENVFDPGPMVPEKPSPGGEITFDAAPSGFQATRPSWADEGTCTAEQWWKYSGDTESSSMHPGHDCVGCHQRERGPSFSFGGTVYPSASEARDCRGVSGVKVELLDADDNVFATTTTNGAGNFYWRKSSVPFEAYRARLSYQGRSREMQLVQRVSGDCNTCHDATGNNGALGRIVAP